MSANLEEDLTVSSLFTRGFSAIIGGYVGQESDCKEDFEKSSEQEGSGEESSGKEGCCEESCRKGVVYPRRQSMDERRCAGAEGAFEGEDAGRSGFQGNEADSWCFAPPRRHSRDRVG